MTMEQYNIQPQNDNNGMPFEIVPVAAQKERRRWPYVTVASLGILAVSGVFGVNGIARAIENHSIIESVTTVDGGESAILRFDDEAEAHCWTATTLQITGSSVKNETRLAGVSTGWKSTTVDMQVKDEVCIDGTTLEVSVEKASGHVSVNVPNKDVLSIQTSIVPGTLKALVDQTPTYVVSDTFQKVLQSTPLLEDTEIAKKITEVTNDQENRQLDIAIVNGMNKSIVDCGPSVLELAKPAVQEGIANLFTRGLKAAQQLAPGIDPTNISILVEGEPFSQVAIEGTESNITDAYAELKKIDDSDDTFTINSGQGECKISDDIKVLADKKG